MRIGKRKAARGYDRQHVVERWYRKPGAAMLVHLVDRRPWWKKIRDWMRGYAVRGPDYQVRRG